MTELCRLSSGYVTPFNPDLEKFRESEPMIHEMVVTQMNLRPDTLNYYDKVVHQLYLQICSDPAMFRSFEYREAIYKKAFSLFKETGFYGWLKLQETNPSFTYVHQQFLLQSLEYVYNGVERPVSCSTYQLILQPLTLDAHFKVADAGKDLKSYHESIKSIHDTRDLYVIYEWTKTVQGVQDLILFLNVVFGKKPYRTTN